MDRGTAALTATIEQHIIRFFSPNGLLSVVVLIYLSVLLLGGIGVEHRTMDRPAVDHQQAVVSPILHNAR